jgi:uncharacterized protein
MKTAHFWFLVAALVSGCVAAAEPVEKADDKDVASLADRFVERLADGDFAAAVNEFDAAMRKALPEEKLKQTWKGVTAQVGPLEARLGARTERVGEYDAVLVACRFEKARLDVRVVYNRSRQISGLFFLPPEATAEYQPPPYARPERFEEREVEVGAGTPWVLPGTLTMPLGDGPFPAVVLVHGSGPHDRDETIGPNKPFRDLAWGLASRGVAVLRYEKRTRQYGARLAAGKDEITVKEETIDDALAALSLLRSTPKVDSSRVFLLGHSLGGMLVPRIQALDDEIAGCIVAAGSTRPLEDIIDDQFRYIFSLEGTISEENEVRLRELAQQVARVKDAGLSPDTPSAELPLGIPAAYWLDLRGYHPAEAARGMTCRILILHGGRDYQVTSDDFEGWKDALSSRENGRFRLYPKLNHLFIEGDGRSTPAEYETAGHVAESVVEEIAAWIKE